jgi:SAM-dependent methyltransferase
MKLEMHESILRRAEAAAGDGDVVPALEILRELPLSLFGSFLSTLPDDNLPKLSAVLPRMAQDAIQDQWTGTHGMPLLLQSVNFVNAVTYGFREHAGRPLDHQRILDYGCGWGRLLRLMLRRSNPDRLVGVDPWDRSVAICHDDGVLGKIVQSEYLPESLPVEGSFDLAYAFSVFSHTSENATKKALSAIRQSISPDGLLAITIRPVEYWALSRNFIPGMPVEDLEASHRATGFAFMPHELQTAAEEKTYGDTSMSLEWLGANAIGWRVVGHDLSLDDPYQIIVFLKPC